MIRTALILALLLQPATLLAMPTIPAGKHHCVEGLCCCDQQGCPCDMGNNPNPGAPAQPVTALERSTRVDWPTQVGILPAALLTGGSGDSRFRISPAEAAHQPTDCLHALLCVWLI